MSTVISFNTAKSVVISLLQASQTAWATTVDGSNQMFPSDSEISNAILSADGEVCTMIAKTPLHPYQTAFVVAPAAVTDGSNTPSRNGMILRVTGQNGTVAALTFANSAVNTTTSLVTSTAHGLVTGQQVQMTTTGGLPSGLALSTTYYIVRDTADAFGFATNIYNAKNGTLISLTTQGTGNHTATTQYVNADKADSKATIDQMNLQPYIYAGQNGNIAGWWFVEGDTFYTTCANARIYYTDYTLTASPQAPEPYLYAVVAGAVAKLLKDGGDANQISFYEAQYKGYLAEIAQNAKMLPEIAEYGV